MKLSFVSRLGLALTFVASVFWVTSVSAATPLSISYEYSNGMFPGGSSFYLQAGMGTYQEWIDNTRIRVNFSITQKEIDNLYANLRWYSFTGIETATAKIYDRGGDQVTLVANGKTITKSNAGQSIIKGSFSRWRYDKTVANLKSFTKKKLAAHYKNYALELEAATDYGVRVAVDDKEVRLHAGVGVIALLPGQHEIIVALYDSSDKNIGSEIFIMNTPDSHIGRVQVRGKDISLTTE